MMSYTGLRPYRNLSALVVASKPLQAAQECLFFTLHSASPAISSATARARAPVLSVVSTTSARRHFGRLVFSGRRSGRSLTDDTVVRFPATRTLAAFKLCASCKAPGGQGRSYSSEQHVPTQPRFRTGFSIAFVILIAIGLGTYFKVEYKRLQEERKEANAAAAAAVTKPKIGGPFHLLDTNGKVVTNEDFLGKFLFIYFGFTHCPDICPEEMEKMTEVIKNLRANPIVGDGITPVFVTCDPQRDGINEVRQYINQFHPDTVGLTGPLEEIAKLAKAYRFFFSAPPDVRPGDDYLVDHSIFLYLMNPHGTFMEVYGRDWTTEEIVENILVQIKQYRRMGGKEGKENVLRQREELKAIAKDELKKKQGMEAKKTVEEKETTKIVEGAEATIASDGRVARELQPLLAS